MADDKTNLEKIVEALEEDLPNRILRGLQEEVDQEMLAQLEYIGGLTEEDRRRMQEPAKEDVWAKLQDHAKAWANKQKSRNIP